MRRAVAALFVGSIVSACAIAEESYETVVYPLEKVSPDESDRRAGGEPRRPHMLRRDRVKGRRRRWPTPA